MRASIAFGYKTENHISSDLHFWRHHLVKINQRWRAHFFSDYNGFYDFLKNRSNDFLIILYI